MFFTHTRISPTITCIQGITDELMYLIEGTNHALLIDSGLGVGDLASYVKALTTLPVTLVLTHGHFDHTAGAPLFKTVYLNQADWNLAYNANTIKSRKEHLAETPCRFSYSSSDFVPAQKVNFSPLIDGQVFELGGGVLAQFFAIPGHTGGSVCALFPHERMLLLGDACCPFTFISFPESSSVSAYQKNLKNFCLAHENKFDTVLHSHCRKGFIVPKAILHTMQQRCAEILTGTDDALPFDFRGEYYAAAKELNASNGCNLIYNPLHKK